MRKIFKTAIWAGASLLAVCAYAENLNWKAGLSSAAIDAAGSWTQESKPGESSTINFKATGDHSEATLSDDLTVQAFYLQGSTVDFRLGDKTLTVAGASQVQGPADASGTSALNLYSGAIVGTGSWSFGATTANPVSVLVSGEDTLLQVNGGDIANGGSGHEMQVLNGGKFLTTGHFCVGNYGDTSTLIVDGVGSVVEAQMNNARLNIGGVNRRGNKIIVRNGGRLEVPSGNYCYMEVGCGGTNGQNARENELLITGAGSIGVIGQLTLSTWAKTNAVRVVDGGTLYVTNSFGAASRDTAWGNQFVVTNAVFEACKRDGATGRADGTIDHGTDFIVAGPQARARFDQLAAKNSSNLYIFDGAVVTNSSQWGFGQNESGNCHLVVSNATLNAGYNINAGNYTSNCSVRVIAGGKIYNPSYFFDIGSQPSGHDDYMIVDGEGSLATVNRFRLGGESSYCWARVSDGGDIQSGSYEIGSSTKAISNRLEVVDGGMLTGWNNATVWFGRNSPGATNSILLVRGGTVDVSRGNGNLNMRNAGILRLEGTNTVVKMNYLQIKENSVIEFKPPEDGTAVETAYVQLKQWNSAHTDGTARLRVVDAEKCMRQGGGTYTLVTCEDNDLNDFSFADVDLPPRAVLLREARAIKVKIPSDRGTVIIVR